MALAARADIVMMRERITEPARYYDSERLIVIRTGLLICEERRHLWHELVHSDRHDQSCHASAASERSVERQAVRWAIPPVTLRWAVKESYSWDDLADRLKLPEQWVRWRVAIAHPAEGLSSRFNC